MPLVNQTVPGIYNGVSEQPPEVRLDNQTETMINCLPHVVSGTQRRRGAKLLSADLHAPADAFTHVYARGDGKEEYIIYVWTEVDTEGVSTGHWHVHDDKGLMVGLGGESDYLIIPEDAKAFNSYAMNTVGDTTYIVNKTVEVTEDLQSAYETTDHNFIFGQSGASIEISGDFAGYQNGRSWFNFFYNGIVTCKLTINGVLYEDTATISINPYGGLSPNQGTVVTPVDLQYAAALNKAITKAADEALAADEDNPVLVKNGNLAFAYKNNSKPTVVISFSVAHGTYSQNSYSNFAPLSKNGSIQTQYYEPSNWDTAFFYWIKRTAGGYTGDANIPLMYTYYIFDEYGGDIGNSGPQADSKKAAEALADAPGVNGLHRGSVIRCARQNLDRFTGGDSWGNQASVAWQGKIRKLSDLPNDLGFDGTVIEVTGDDQNGFTNFYVQFAGGVYKEVARPGLPGKLHPTTMPHALVRGQAESGAIQFYFTPIDYTPSEPFTDDYGNTLLSEGWGERTAGDADSAPMPSFVGQKISDIFFFKNRLGLTSQGNVILSASGDYYKFFPSSVTDILDSDTIDVAVDSNQVVDLVYALPFAKELLLFGGNAQFVLSSTTTLTPKSVSIQQSTAFEINVDAKPVALGPNVYFPIGHPGSLHSSKIREYYVVPDTATNDAADITAHVPHFIPGGVTKIVGCSNHDMLFVLTSSSDYVYVYSYMWQGEQKSQSAWHLWDFGGKVSNIEVFGSHLSVILEETVDGSTKLVHKSVNLGGLKNMSDIPDHTYEDELHDGTFVNYDSRIDLSKWGLPAGKAATSDNQRLRLSLRDTQFSVSGGSKYNLEVTKKGNDTPKTYSYVPDNKFSTMGDVNNIKLAVTSKDSEGFQIFSMNYRGNVSNISKAL